MVKKLILFPFSGNTREAMMAVDAINASGEKWRIIGFIDDNAELKGREYCGIKVLGGKEILKEHPDAFVLAAPGQPKNYLKRKSVIDSLDIEASRFAQIIHPSVQAAKDAKIGINVLIMANAVISANVQVGDHCVILPNTTVSHDSTVGQYTCIGSNVSVSGGVTIGEEVYIGSGASLRDGISVGDRSLVGLGSNVVKNVDSNVTVAGNPAKVFQKI